MMKCPKTGQDCSYLIPNAEKRECMVYSFPCYAAVVAYKELKDKEKEK